MTASFTELGLSQELLKAVEDLGFEEPSPIQVLAIPALLTGKDAVGQAQTGTGKTAAFGLPILEKIASGKSVQALVLCPTRELAIQVSEELSKLLKREGIPHQVLNAKYHAKEAEIVALAGQMNAVTIATNMAGRGTDIKLGEGVAELGGLKIIGTERHESRRIDNQLRGRAGRQGDPGESRFYISLEDDLMRLFGSEKTMKLVDAMGMDEDEPIEAGMLTKAIENAQKKVEGNNFAVRKHLLEYDQVMNEQREVIYGERKRVLYGENLRDSIMGMISQTIDRIIDAHISDEQMPEEWDMNALSESFSAIIPVGRINIKEDALEKMTKDKLKENLKMNVYATADNCMDKLKSDYDIDDSYTPEQQRILAGIRYEMQLRGFSLSNRFTLAEDVPLNVVTELKERGVTLPGMDIVEEALRSVAQGDVVPHEIGTVGPIYAEEYEKLKSEGYALDDTVGKSGIERAMESTLRGTDGIKEITVENGVVVSSDIQIKGNLAQLLVS